MTARNRKQQGFTLVEILIVVIILGILAAIVIPQFTNASTEARNNSTRSLLQTVRSQIELYKLQHGDRFPTADGTAAGAWDWTKLTGKTEVSGAAGDGSADDVGPYLQATPVNPLNKDTAVEAAGTFTGGWVFDSSNGKFSATNEANTALFVE